MNMILSESKLSKINDFCRVCKGKNLQKVLSLGSTPPANAFLKAEDLQKPEPSFPLEVYFCNDCSFAQLLDIVSPEFLFGNYVYVSSTSPSFVAHFKSLAESVVGRFNFAADSLIVDIGSNDGILLRPFKELGWRVLGVDPAANIAARATESGIETKPAFFTPAVAEEILATKGKPKIITATSVFPHVDNLDELVAGVKNLLADDGVFMIEAYYILDLLEKNLFDTVYHEHLSYFSVKTITQLFERLGMKVFDVEKTDTHGGSLRVFVQKATGQRPVNEVGLQVFLDEEINKSVYKLETYLNFAKKVEANKSALVTLLSDLKSQGKKIVGYGAPAKGNTLLNYFEIGHKVLDYLVDDSPWKQGLYAPGTHIPVLNSEELSKNPPDYILILAWNFVQPIMNKLLEHDVKFIIPVPKPIVINNLVDQDLYTIVEALSYEAKVLEGKRVVITGGSGFLGSYFIAVIEFLNKNYFTAPCKVVSMDNHIVGKSNNLLKEISDPNITFLEQDVCVPFTVDGEVDYIINAAGVASPVYYQRYPIQTIEGTVFGLKNTLELARDKKVKSLLYFSSSEIYGDPDPNFIPTPETYKGNVSSIGPRSCYDESKRVGETLAMAFHRVHDVPIKIVRPFNVYGPGMSSKDYRVIPTFLSQGLEGKPLTVHDKGNQTRTFCYVTDAIIGFLKVLFSEKAGEVYNIGNDNDEINMLGLAETVSSVVFEKNAQANLVNYPDSYPQDEPRRRCPDLTKARNVLSYEPTVNLKTGLKRSFVWMKGAVK